MRGEDQYSMSELSRSTAIERSRQVAAVGILIFKYQYGLVIFNTLNLKSGSSASPSVPYPCSICNKVPISENDIHYIRL